MLNRYDVIIIGGGFFGLYIADYFSKFNKKILVLEKENDAMLKASYVNQARVHNGYHYQRDVLTALRSRISFPRFIDEFEECIESDFDKYYMISEKLGNITAKQFEKFCNRIGAKFTSAQSAIHRLVNPNLIDGIFKAKEFVFNSSKLKKIMLKRIKNNGVDIRFNHKVTKVEDFKSSLKLSVDIGSELQELTGNQVFNCTYSLLNYVLSESKIKLIPLRHEMTEICIIDVPQELKKIGLTVMCGPFFSILPFPSKKAYSFSHVRYTPHYEWDEVNDKSYFDAYQLTALNQRRSAFNKMKKDAQRYIPILAKMKYKESSWGIKTILPKSSINDSRPILFKANYGLQGFHCVLGGKIDNVYDAIQTISDLGLEK